MLTTASLRPVCGPLLAALALAAPAARAQSGYAIVDLGLAGGVQSDGLAINNSGQVAGDASIPGGMFSTLQGVLWTGTSYLYLKTLGGSSSSITGLNDGGQVTGFSVTASGLQHAVRWDGAAPTDLGTLGGMYSNGYGINNSGQVAGSADLANGAGHHAARWTGTKAEDLPSLDGGVCYAFGINDAGQVVGNSGTLIDGVSRAAIWNGTTPATLTGLSSGQSSAYAINSSGQITGFAYLANNRGIHAVRWTGGTPTDLGVLAGANSYGKGINSAGDVVGYSDAPGAAQHAFLYKNGRMIDLNSALPMGSGWELYDAFGINDRGWITGSGRINGQIQAYLLKPSLPTVSGSIALEGVPDLSAISPAALLGAFHIAFREPGTTIDAFTADVTLTTKTGSPRGAYSVPNISPGVYDVAIKGRKNLQVLLPRIAVSGATALPVVMLPAGDANNDNSCDTSDFNTLTLSYGSAASLPGSGYDPNADFNFDGSVDTTDFGLFVGNNGARGAM